MKKPTLDNEESKIRFQPVNVLGTPPSGIVKEYERKILTKEVDGFLLIPADVIRTRKTSFLPTTSPISPPTSSSPPPSAPLSPSSCCWG